MTRAKKKVGHKAHSPQPPPTRPLRGKQREQECPQQTTPAGTPVNLNAMRAMGAFDAATRIQRRLLNANPPKDKNKPATGSEVDASRGAAAQRALKTCKAGRDRLNKKDQARQGREAIAQFERAALLGLGKAANELVQTYLLGVGTPIDLIAAQRWFHKALSLGSSKALCEAARSLLSQGAVDAAAKVLSHPSKP
eukprot:m.85583 g.85583  ORF g.85583 m.85583 type:complete len:195 (+) comp11397_c2_seq1:157-741(+)